MSGGAPTTSGGMSAGTGTTTPVSSGLSRLAPPDQSVLCSAICKCQATPGIGKDGRKLNQVCVSSRLKELDKVLQGRSPYKPEVNYDMTQEPPEPIMNSEDATQPHGWLRGWIDKYWGDPDKDRPEWKASRGYVRRPDVVIVNDPTISPTQDNIRMVVEIKFPNDDPGTGQMKAYERIAGSEAKVVLLESSECDCNQVEERERQAEELDKYAVPASQALYTLLRVYLRGRLPPLPGGVPVPAPAIP
ncbi:MAG: VRR-NUC domain-containing protein [Pigmentiphaga sp.]|uniref:VRR-NUC domain-containing protein n=1 Tax=Achromobacter pulmonis TaxID=1389932 RepID=UPI001F22368B|nr:VRR-NUC domain-containing protein [Achromobacter pulmonis]